MPVLDTSEVRWFAEGWLPHEVVDWFTCGGKVGTLEERCDTYQVNRRHDMGVKQRYRTSLDVKVRRGIGDTLVLAPGLAAPVEVWRKWSLCLGDDQAPPAGDAWIEVEKSVITRTMWADDDVVGATSHVDYPRPGCDVEIAAVTVAGVKAWSFAFEAFGSPTYRSRLIRSAWEMVIARSGAPEQLAENLVFTGGYPEWLTHRRTHRIKAG